MRRTAAIEDGSWCIFPLFGVDRNHNGLSEAGELQSLEEAGVITISLDPRESRRQDRFGNEFRFRSELIVERNGRTLQSTAVDVFLATAGRSQ